MMLVYMTQNFDKGALGTASIMGMQKDTVSCGAVALLLHTDNVLLVYGWTRLRPHYNNILDWFNHR